MPAKEAMETVKEATGPAKEAMGPAKGAVMIHYTVHMMIHNHGTLVTLMKQLLLVYMFNAFVLLAVR